MLRNSISNLIDEVIFWCKQNSQSIWNRIRSLRYFSMLLFLMRLTTENTRITHEKKFGTHEIPRRKILGPTKYPGEKNLGPTKYPGEKNLGPTKYPLEKMWDPRNTQEKKIWDPRNIHEKTFETHKISMKARWHDATKSTRSTKFSTL